MAMEVHSDTALIMKKRARRRLVGSIALVLIMLIILPQILQNKADVSSPESVTITMVDRPPNNEALDQVDTQVNEKINEVELPNVDMPILSEEVQDEVGVTSQDAEVATEEMDVATTPSSQVKAVPESLTDKSEPDLSKQPLVKPEEAKKLEAKKIETVKPITSPASNNNSPKYLIQVGVFAEEDNVKRLQAKIGLAGLSSYTTEVKSPEGKMYRLRVGSFVTREAAATALKKLQANGVAGMVMTDD